MEVLWTRWEAGCGRLRTRAGVTRQSVSNINMLTVQLSQAEQDFVTKTAFADPDAVRGEY